MDGIHRDRSGAKSRSRPQRGSHRTRRSGITSCRIPSGARNAIALPIAISFNSTRRHSPLLSHPCYAHSRRSRSNSQWYGTSTDITELKQLEAERSRLLAQEQAAREAAETANRLKDEFLAVLSHELRSPLNPILGWTRLLQSGKINPTRQAEALATIERNAVLQTQLIEDLLDISRIMQGKLSLTTAPVNLTLAIAAALETVSLAAEAKQIAIELDLAEEIPPAVGDAARLQQVLWNLLANAVKFTPNGGRVTVQLQQLDRTARIRVADTGKGINPKFLPHVFDYFRQEDGSTTRKFGGLGLGLAIVRQIVEMHGGTVTAESPGEGQGSAFTVTLPLIAGTPSAPSAGRFHSPENSDRVGVVPPCLPPPQTHFLDPWLVCASWLWMTTATLANCKH
ncbi:MAG: HAMP domain-containing histidine kinase [Oscillatoriales cyanobacterium RU_3_3]|nr:HAMP domain-containing histidine kinase [Oscillatoriales cyanobacterium RU_3_3]